MAKAIAARAASGAGFGVAGRLGLLEAEVPGVLRGKAAAGIHPARRREDPRAGVVRILALAPELGAGASQPHRGAVERPVEEDRTARLGLELGAVGDRDMHAGGAARRLLAEADRLAELDSQVGEEASA